MSTGNAPGLVVVPRLPWPLDDGGRLGLWQFVDGVARERPAIVAALVPPDEVDTPLPDVFAARGIEVIRVPHRPPSLPRAALAGLFDPTPVVVARYRNDALARTLERLVRERRPAFALLQHLHLAPYAEACRPAPVILRQHNVEHLWFARYAASLGNPLTRAYVADQAERMRRLEARLCAAVDLVLAIHEDEARLLRAIAPRAHVEVVPFGLAFPEALPVSRAERPVVLLLGTWSWPPNARGALRFLREGWPGVRAEVPDAELHVVGKGATPALRAAAQAAGRGVRWIGYVPAMAEAWTAARVLVVPLWEGAGVRVKIVESVAAGVPVVSTALGAEGLELEPGRHYLREDEPRALARGVAGLLRDPDAGRRLAAAAFERARGLYSLDATAARLRALLATIVAPTGAVPEEARS